MEQSELEMLARGESEWAEIDDVAKIAKELIALRLKVAQQDKIITAYNSGGFGDADAVMLKYLEALAAVEEANGKLERIAEWCDAYPFDCMGGIFDEPDMAEVQKRLGPDLLTKLSAHNFRHVLKGIKRIIEAQ
jgi:hypothetical protein